jgi:hypothetical protein
MKRRKRMSDKPRSFNESKFPKAVLLTFNIKTKEMNYTEFDGDVDEDVVSKAKGLWDSIKDDFPDCIACIPRNVKAAKNLTVAMFGPQSKFTRKE